MCVKSLCRGGRLLPDNVGAARWCILCYFGGFGEGPSYFKCWSNGIIGSRG